MKVLLAEDDIDYAKLMKLHLGGAGHLIDWVPDGKKALEKLRVHKYDMLITDWLMPELDGIGLIQAVRKEIDPIPPIMMLTSISDAKGKAFALKSGADDFVSKTVTKEDLLTHLDELLARMKQELPVLPPKAPAPVTSSLPPFVGVVIVASTGGPPVLTSLLSQLPKDFSAGVYIVQHAPEWMLDSFAKQLKNDTGFDIELGKQGVTSMQGKGYLAPGDRHMCVDQKNFSIQVNKDEKVNFVRPAADPLFRSVADAFGKHSVAVILTGLGRDGAAGASEVKNAGGSVIVQDPKTAVAPSMPRTAIELGLVDEILPIDEIAAAIVEKVRVKSAVLSSARK